MRYCERHGCTLPIDFTYTWPDEEHNEVCSFHSGEVLALYLKLHREILPLKRVARLEESSAEE